MKTVRLISLTTRVFLMITLGLGVFFWLAQLPVLVGRKRLQVSVQEASGEKRERLWARIIAYHAGHEVYQQRTPYPLPVVILHPEKVL